MKIYGRMGHGGKDSGAVGPNRTEANDNLQYGTAVMNKLAALGHTVKVSRTNDTYRSLSDIVNEANLWGADLFLDFHRNDYDEKANGASMHVAPKASQKSKELAKAMTEAVLPFGFKDRSSGRGYVVQEKNNYTVAHTTMPAVIVELGFIKNVHDNTIFDTQRVALTSAIADAVSAVAGGSVSPSPSTPAPAPSVPALVDANGKPVVLKRGSKEKELVKHAQRCLNKHRAYRSNGGIGKVDGDFGEETEKAVNAFQAARIKEGRDVGCGYNGNKPDGKVGVKTWAILWE